MTFTAERDVDTQHPEERLRASQAATQHVGIFGPLAPVEIPSQSAQARKRSAAVACPGTAAGHDLPYRRSNGVGINSALDRSLGVCFIDQREVPAGQSAVSHAIAQSLLRA
jgi:hypothetical protein